MEKVISNFPSCWILRFSAVSPNDAASPEIAQGLSEKTNARPLDRDDGWASDLRELLLY